MADFVAPERPTSPGGRENPAVHVLVVDDEESVRRLELAILKQLGLAAVGVASGDEAVRFLSQHEARVVVSDSQMPSLVNGPRLYEWVRVNRPALARRFAFVTGYVEAERLLPAGVPVLLKPFKLAEFVATIRALLGEP